MWKPQRLVCDLLYSPERCNEFCLNRYYVFQDSAKVCDLELGALEDAIADLGRRVCSFGSGASSSCAAVCWLLFRLEADEAG